MKPIKHSQESKPHIPSRCKSYVRSLEEQLREARFIITLLRNTKDRYKKENQRLKQLTT